MRLSSLSVAMLLVVFSLVGCNKSAAPTVERSERVAATKPDWQLVTLHIDGFKKSKSGGI